MSATQSVPDTTTDTHYNHNEKEKELYNQMENSERMKGIKERQQGSRHISCSFSFCFCFVLALGRFWSSLGLDWQFNKRNKHVEFRGEGGGVSFKSGQT